MCSARIPDKEITWLGTDLLPSIATLFQPSHSSIREAEPLWSPRWDPGLIFEDLVELFRSQVRAFADDKTAVIWSIWEQIY